MKGRVKSKHPKGYGHVRANEIDYFFHTSECKSDFNEIQIGDKVNFEQKQTPKGWRALNVEVVYDEP